MEEYFSCTLAHIEYTFQAGNINNTLRHFAILLTDELLHTAVIHWTIGMEKPIRSLLRKFIISKLWKQIGSDAFFKIESRTVHIEYTFQAGDLQLKREDNIFPL
jgi:hypothetical protein